jgi:hypothetical protein
MEGWDQRKTTPPGLGGKQPPPGAWGEIREGANEVRRLTGREA